MTGIDLHHVILIMVSIILIKMVMEIIIKVAQARYKKVPNMILEYRQGEGFTYPYHLDIEGEGVSKIYTKHQLHKKFQEVVRHPYARTVCEGGLEEVFKDPNKKMLVREIKTRALYIKVGEKERCIVLEEL